MTNRCRCPRKGRSPNVTDKAHPTETGLRGLLKAAVRRALRPAVWDLQQSVARLESAVGEFRAAQQRQARHGAVWRGGADGSAYSPGGDVDHAATLKYRDELEYWIAAVAGSDPAHGPRFVEVFSTWQITRLNELADRLALDRGAPMDQWCAGRDVVEIGGGPIPCCAFRRFRSAVAIDPLADGYMACNLMPAAALGRGIVHLSACGESIPLCSASADLVIAENCLDHTDEPALVVNQIFRILRPGGYLWLLVDLMDYRDHMHPSPMSPQRLDSLLTPLGMVTLYNESWEGASHPMARLQLRMLVQKPPA
ncbi:MAG: hypothetical protein GIKADHBN_00949 [Phycisphaerales bacterium]|nr:hypothetical protein [Phycisphaerales bacterium]